MKFKALIDGVHYDPKKGTVKIALVATSFVSLDELTIIGSKDESILVTLESEQTKLDDTLTPYGRALEPGSREERELESKGHDRAEELVMKGLGLDGDDDDVLVEEVKDVGDPITLKGEKGAEWLKKAADRLKEGNVDAGPLEERAPEKRPYLDPDDVPPDGLPIDEGEAGDSKHESEEEGAEVEGDGQGGII